MSTNEKILKNCRDISNLIKDIPDMMESTKNEINGHIERVLEILDIEQCKG